MIPQDPYYWQQYAKVQKSDSKHLPDEAYCIYQYLKGLQQYTLIAALIAAYRDHDKEWLEAFKKQYLDSFIDPDSEKARAVMDADLISELRHYKEIVKSLALPTKIEQLQLF